MRQKRLIKSAIVFIGIIIAISLYPRFNSGAENNPNTAQYYYPKGYKILNLSEGRSPGVIVLTAVGKNGKAICLWYEEGNSTPFKEIMFSPK